MRCRTGWPEGVCRVCGNFIVQLVSVAHTLKTPLCSSATLAACQKAGQKFLLRNLMDGETKTMSKKQKLSCCKLHDLPHDYKHFVRYLLAG